MKRGLAVLMAVLLLGLCPGCKSVPAAEREPFLEMMEAAAVPCWLAVPYASAGDIPGDEAWHLTMRGLLTNLRAHYDAGAGIEPKRRQGRKVYYTTEEIRCVSMDFLGYDYVLVVPSETGVIRQADEVFLFEDPGLTAAEIDADSFSAKGDEIYVEAVLRSTGPDGGESFEWRMGYRFTYMPDNAYIPYRFAASEKVGGRAPWE